LLFIVAMNDGEKGPDLGVGQTIPEVVDGLKEPEESSSKRGLEEIGSPAKEDGSFAKRSRGPSDCLNWDTDEDGEFVPYTQERPDRVASPPPLVFAKKSSAKEVSKRKNVAKNGKSGRSNVKKGKSLGENFFVNVLL
jgi:hypothetical protein